MDKKKRRSPPTSSLGRASVVGATATQVAAKKITTSAKSLFLNSADRDALKKKSRQEIAEMIFEGLSQLRGTALKFAQVLCGETGLLPDEYMKVFEQSHYRVPPLSRAVVQSMVRGELGADPLKLFKEFDWNAIAAASLGQVHRATLVDGTPVVVKVQYPGVSDTILTDFKLARRALIPFGNAGLILSVLDELEDRLRLEVDYQNEIEHINLFKKQRLPDGIHLPVTYSELSKNAVITMGFMPGKHLNEWLESNPNQETKNQVANRLWQWFLHSVFNWGLLHADPNFGNYLMHDNGEVGIIDFGAIKEIKREDQNFYRILWNTTPGNEDDRLMHEYFTRGAKGKKDSMVRDAIRPYLEWIQNLVSQSHFEFPAHPDFVKQGHEIFSGQMFNVQLNEFRSELTLIHRGLLGLSIVCNRLGATIAVDPHRDLWKIP